MAVVTTNSLQVYSGNISGTPLQIAKDYLEGYTGDYLFARLDDDSYILILAGDIDDAGLCSDCDIFEINAVPYSVGYQGGYEIQSGHSSSIQVYNANNYLVYSSEVGFPHLITREEGVESYAFASIVLSLVLLFYLCYMSIYKHIGL